MVSADWRFLLPGLSVERMLCIDVPSAANVAVLSATAGEVVVVCTDSARLSEFKSKCEEKGGCSFKFEHVATYADLPFAAESFTFIRIAKTKTIKLFLQKKALQKQLASLLRPNGVLNFELRGRPMQAAGRSLIKRLTAAGLKKQQQFWLTPFSGEMRTAVPLEAEDIAEFFFENVLYGQSWRKRTMSRAGSFLSRCGLLNRVMPRRTVFLQKSNIASQKNRLPKFLCNLAGKANIDLADYRFGLSTRGKYNANKPIYYLFPQNSNRPDAVIKMTRAPEFNYRLENEYRALAAIREGNFVYRESYPEPLFFDTHNGLAVLSQKAVHGAPFRARTQASKDCPLAHAAVDWLVQLGSKSVNSNLVDGPAVAENLGKLFKRFTEIYSLSTEERGFLQTQLDVLQNSDGAFPLVFQHGDPGTWNILVSEDNSVIFIDWEAGEPRGIPLWDMFYFMRTFASWVLRQQGSSDPLQNFATNFLQPSPFVDWLAQIIQTYCCNINLDGKLVAPLFYTCWMHRSLKESARLTNDTLTDGHYFNLLKLCISNAESVGLQTIFSAAQVASQHVSIEKRMKPQIC